MPPTLTDLIVRFGLEDAHPDSAAIVGLQIAHDLLDFGPFGEWSQDAYNDHMFEAIEAEREDDGDQDDSHWLMVEATAHVFYAVLSNDAKPAAAPKVISEASLRKRIGITNDSEQTSPRATAAKLASSVMTMMRPGLHYSDLVDRAAVFLSPEAKEGLTSDQSYQDIVFGLTSGMLDILTTQEAA